MIVINKTRVDPIVEVGNNKVNRDMNKSNKKDSNHNRTINQRGNLIIRNHFVKLNFVHMKLPNFNVDYIHTTRILS